MSRRTIYTIHQPRVDHLADVIAEMQTKGSPTIRVVDCGDHYEAIEGTHRLFAAAKLDLPVILDIVAYDAEIADHDIQDLPSITTAADILDLYSIGRDTVSVEVIA